MFAPFTLITLFGALFTTSLATPTRIPMNDISAEHGKMVNGTFVPSQKTLDQHADFYNNLYVKDPETDKYIPNPAYKKHNKHDKRASLWYFPSGSVCKFDISHSWSINENYLFDSFDNAQSYETMDSRLYNNDNGDVLAYLGSMEITPSASAAFPIDGYRTIYIEQGSSLSEKYGLDWAWGNFYGFDSRNMMGSYWCWYQQGTAGWGDWGTAACLQNCYELQWHY